jgi:hypothetical protein
MKQVTVTLISVLERARSLNERHGFKLWDAVENAIEDAKDEVGALDAAAVEILRLEGAAFRGEIDEGKRVDWDAVLRRARDEA